MTGKRFSVFKSKITGLFVVNDNTHEFAFEGVEDAGTIMKLVGLLNNYIEENEQLKHRLAISEKANFVTALEEENEQLRHDATILIQSNQDYRRENEQLKHQLQQQEMEYATTCNQLAEENEQLKTTIQQLRTDNTKQKKLLNKTMKQNKHTTTTIQNMMENERTELGQSVLRQLWSAIQ